MTPRKDIHDILKPIEHYLMAVDETVKSKLYTGIDLLDDSSMHTFKKSGKKIRASMIILSGGLNNTIPDEIIDIACAAEIIHAASLVHDDIIDNADLRRGLPTVSRKYGPKVAVLAGDYMYTKALEIAVGNNRTDLFPIMVDATVEMVKGELYQIQYSDIDNITIDNYYRIIEMKTARFMAACAKLGAAVAKMNTQQSDVLYECGLQLGYAFQITDDAMDYLNAADITGKDAGNDFINGKITLPLLHLLEVADNKERALLKNYAKTPDNDNWNYVVSKAKEYNVVDYCISIASDYVKKAIEIISMFPDNQYKNILTELALFFVDRKY
ncbi:MAG TPA: polyprenyl synthetase family protein [Spirochaetota bacterium]|nr:polyprenyl synthetase family protein [Spirochaetota bacterium]HOT19055.1 polyprenyl synthetase family protein [Spirochaetota bacterium]HPD04688.1 polyprenyl synthetase family protein [Spirochaetota bacterium]HQG41295.1 polyprenyl synthetase family protein [Spirochaetota bacterium]HRR59936.1 polyprenyl synthetase family protein [Spirochaetota bacterium]